MGIIVKDSGSKDFEITPSGMHVARCYLVVELGPQKTVWNEEVKWLRKVRLSFELPNCLMNEGESAGKPFSVSNNYTQSLGRKANLRRDLEGWRNKAFTDQELEGFELFNIVGKPCMINVVHNESGGNIYANIASISPIMQGMDCPPPVNAPVVFSIGEYTSESFNALPEWLRNKINLETPQATGGQHSPVDGSTEDEYRQMGGNPQEVYQQAGATNHQQTYGNQMAGMDSPNGIVDDDIPF